MVERTTRLTDLAYDLKVIERARACRSQGCADEERNQTGLPVSFDHLLKDRSPHRVFFVTFHIAYFHQTCGACKESSLPNAWHSRKREAGNRKKGSHSFDTRTLNLTYESGFLDGGVGLIGAVGDQFTHDLPIFGCQFALRAFLPEHLTSGGQ